MTDTRDIVHHFADFAAGLRYEDLTPEAREAAKKSILDTLGVILAASGMEPAARVVRDIVLETGGSGQCTLLGFPGKGPALMAAFQNGGLAHCLDYDDQTPWGQHAASSVVPAVLALAERQGGISGRDLIAAVAVGQDIFARLRCNVGWKKDWNLSTVMGVYSATAAAGRAMGLPHRKIAHAIGIASMQCSGIMEMVAGRGSDLRGLYAGFSAKGAVLAAMMAEKGLTGIEKMFEGTYGFFNTYFGGRYDRDKILEGLGKTFLGAGTLYKRWPCVGTSHSHMKAIIDILVENDLPVERIAEIRLHVGDYHDLMCQPMAERCAPATLADAKFSLPFLVAVAAVRRGMSVRDFSEDGLHDPRILATARKMTLVADPALNWTLDLPPGRVEVFARDGRQWLRVGEKVPGNADAPLDWDQLGKKFDECASVAAVTLAPDRLSRAKDIALDLDSVADATELIRLLG